MVALGKLGFSRGDYRLFVKVLAHFIRDISFEVYDSPTRFRQSALGSSIPACLKEPSVRVVREASACFLRNMHC